MTMYIGKRSGNTHITKTVNGMRDGVKHRIGKHIYRGYLAAWKSNARAIMIGRAIDAMPKKWEEEYE